MNACACLMHAYACLAFRPAAILAVLAALLCHCAVLNLTLNPNTNVSDTTDSDATDNITDSL